VALGLLGALIVISFLYSRVAPYRELRAAREVYWRGRTEFVRGPTTGLQPEDLLREEQWYRFQLRVERDVYGSAPGAEGTAMKLRGYLPRREAENLQEALNRERAGLFLAQFVFLVAIGFLLAARL